MNDTRKQHRTINKREALRVAHALVASEITSWCDIDEMLETHSLLTDHVVTYDDAIRISDALLDLARRHKRAGENKAAPGARTNASRRQTRVAPSDRPKRPDPQAATPAILKAEGK